MAFVFAPLAMSGLAAFLAMRPQKPVAETGASSALKTAATVLAKVNQGFGDDAAVKRAEFEIDTVKVMRDKVDQEDRAAVDDTIRRLEGEKQKQVSIMMTRRLQARLQETETKLASKNTTAEEVQRIRTDLASAASEVDKIPQAYRDAMSDKIARLGETLGAYEVVISDRRTLREAEASLATEMSTGSLSRLKGAVLDVQSRLEKSSLVSGADIASIKSILQKVDRKTDSATAQAVTGSTTAPSGSHEALKNDISSNRFLSEADPKIRQLHASNAISTSDAQMLIKDVANRIKACSVRFANMQGLVDGARNDTAKRSRVLSDLRDISARVRSGQCSGHMSQALASQLEEAIRALGGTGYR